MTDYSALLMRLRKSWCEDTAFGKWSPDNPAMNQCAVTALIVQDYFGGDLLVTSDGSHYWNRLPDGSELDLTAEQFKCVEEQPNRDDYCVTGREYLTTNVRTSERYELLKKKVEECQ